MSGGELLRKLRKMGAAVTPYRGKGGHVMVTLGGKVTFVPTHGKRELGKGLLAKILRELEITERDLP